MTTIAKKSTNSLVTETRDASEFLMQLVEHYQGITNIPRRKLSPSLLQKTKQFLKENQNPATTKQLAGFLDYLAICLNQKPPPTDTLEQYINTFKNVPYPVLHKVAEEIVKTHVWPRYPSIADIWAKTEPHLKMIKRLEITLDNIANLPEGRQRGVAPNERNAVARQLSKLISKLESQTQS